MAAKDQMKAGIRDLAQRIYVGLVGEACQLTEQSVKMSTSAENLARVSFKLATAFHTVEEQLDAHNAPTSSVLDSATIESWNK